jgi:hypothetical protein
MFAARIVRELLGATAACLQCSKVENMWFRFRLSTLFIAVPLFGMATFAGLKWYEKIIVDEQVEFVYPCEPPAPTIAPANWVDETETRAEFPESDFGPIPVERPIKLP